MRTLTPAARVALFGGETGESLPVLLLIEDVGLESPLRFANNTENILSRAHGEAEAQEYLAFPFALKLPDEREDQPSGMRIEIDNVDQRIMAAIRPLVAPPRLTAHVILASEPDASLTGPIAGRVASVDYDAQKISAILQGPAALTETFPYRIFNPADWPGVF